MQRPDRNITGFIVNNISDYLKLNSEKHPEKPAFLYPRIITYRNLEKEVNQYSFRLAKSGITAGTTTLVLVPAGIDFFILIFALFRVGAIPIMIDPGMGIKAMVKVLAEAEPEAFIGTAKAYLLRFAYPSSFKKTKSRIILGKICSGKTGFLKKQNDNISVNYNSANVDPDGMAAIFFTSGSTGPAKGVIYTPAMLRNQIEITRSQFNIGNDEVDLCTFPLLGLFALCHGNTSVLAKMDMLHPAKLDPKKVIGNILDFKCTQMFGSPMVLNKLAEYGLRKGIKLSSLKNIISAGAPVHSTVLKSFLKLLSEEAEIHTPFGATEALPVTDITASEILKISSGEQENETGICVGHPIEPLIVKILEISDQPVESWDKAKILDVDEVGEITVKGAWVSKAYFGRNEANLLARIPDRVSDEIWYRMGDLGRLDTKGRIWFYGRKSQRVITAYGTLFTIPCEAVFNRHPGVARSALAGVPDGESGFKKPVICIQLKKGVHPSNKLNSELLELGGNSSITNRISVILYKKDFPVDPRHNAKIFREKLALWAAKKIK